MKIAVLLLILRIFVTKCSSGSFHIPHPKPRTSVSEFLNRTQEREMHDFNYTKTDASRTTQSFSEHFSPWIAYRGCFSDNYIRPIVVNKGVRLAESNVGMCFEECERICNTNLNKIYFGLQMNLCLCTCLNMSKNYSDSSTLCDSKCDGTSFNNGVCGGRGYISMYEKVNSLDITANGRCLAYKCNITASSSVASFFGMNCSRKLLAKCIHVRPLSSAAYPTNGVLSWEDYWEYCSTSMDYVSGITPPYKCKFHDETQRWTGVRQFPINIRKTQNKSSTTQSALKPKPFLPSTEKASERRTMNGIIVGTVVGVAVLVTAVVISIVIAKRRHRMKKDKKYIKNPTYDLSILTTTRTENRTVEYANEENIRMDNCPPDTIYTESQDGEYDQLNTPKRKVDTSTNVYDSTINMEGNYSTTVSTSISNNTEYVYDKTSTIQADEEMYDHTCHKNNPEKILDETYYFSRGGEIKDESKSEPKNDEDNPFYYSLEETNLEDQNN